MNPFLLVQQINTRLALASRQAVANARALKPEDVVPVDAAAIEADKAQRAALNREITRQFLTMYFDPALVRDGEPVLAALFRIFEGEGKFLRSKCGAIMDAVVDFEIAFDSEGDLILMRDESIEWACRAVGFSSNAKPDWSVEQLPTGQRVFRKAIMVAPHG